MRALFTLAFLLQSLLATSAFADTTTLFTIRKPVNPENLVQTFVSVGPSCAISDIDFYWLMNGTQPKTPNGMLRCNILKRLRKVAPDANNKAGCPKDLPPGSACFQKFLMADEIGKTGQNFPLVIRSVKSASTGKCSVAAFIDLGDKVVQVKQVNTNGKMLSQGLTGATVQFTGVEIVGMDNKVAANLSCKTNCTENISADFSCQL
jgi:hypothetical protein